MAQGRTTLDITRRARLEASRRPTPGENLPGAGRSAPMRRQVYQIATSAAWALGSWTIIILLWELSVAQGWIHRTLFPPPSRFIPYLLQGGATIGIGPNAATIEDSILATLLRVTAGLVIGMLVAASLGVAASAFRPVRQAIMPVVRTLAPIAPIAWIPIGLVLFGIGNTTIIFIVTLGVVFSLTVATVAAIDGVDEELLKTARSLGARRWHLWVHVTLPAAAPQFFTVVRMNFFGAWMAVLAAEMVGLRSGLGAMIIIGREQFNNELVLIGIVVIGLCGFFVDAVLLQIQRRVLWWGEQ